jgi:5-methylcytosine-specific restriction endonuclease McrBC GTP-binding regulatory subunit McrB
MNIKDIITSFRNHQLEYGLGGDSEQQELYKWKLLTKQVGHPNTDAKDFTQEIYSLDLQNLCYPPQVTAYRNFAKYEPEAYRLALKRLFEENVDLQQRTDNFISTCKTLWDTKIKSHFEQKTSAMCDERLISCFLTLRFPQKYTFYKNDVYKELCQILGVEQKKAGKKMVHFYELLNKYVIPIVNEDKVLMNSINEELNNNSYILSTPLIAQTALWYYVTKNLETPQTIEEQTNNTSMAYQTYTELLKENHNLVLTGAPGTGKTFMAKEIAKEMGCSKDEMCFVQFHPSYDYTDFVEGLRPVEKDDGQMGFERIDGVFKDFCKKAVKNLIDSQKSIDSLTKELSWEEKLQQFIEDSIEKNTKYKLSNGNEFTIDEIRKRTIVVYNDKNEKASKILVNADDVIELLSNDVPLNIVRDIRNHFNRKFGTQQDSYTFIITKKIREMKKKVIVASADKIERKNYVFIIDEINRGEASKIFGELFYAIDPGYRGKNDILVKTQYQNLIPDTDLYCNGFYVPENVYILATMNDIDRSVESMDFAMRRRFTWKEVTPSDTQSMLDQLPCADKAKKTMTRLNNKIAETEGLGYAYMVGPSYFLKLNTNGGDFDKLWNMNISPLLKEYLRGFRKSDEIMDKFKKAYFDTSDELEQS